MAVKSRADIQTELDSILINTASEGSITPEVLKGILEDILDSSLNTPTDTNLQGFYPWDATIQYYTNAIVQYDYKWYKANTNPALTGVFDTADWDFMGYVTYSKAVTITTASVLTMNTTPVTLISAIASKYIQVTNVTGQMTYNSSAYATNTSLDIYSSVGGAPNVSFTLPSFLAGTASKHKVATITANASLETNQAVKVRVNTGDPTAGDSDITIYISYIVI